MVPYSMHLQSCEAKDEPLQPLVPIKQDAANRLLHTHSLLVLASF